MRKRAVLFALLGATLAIGTLFGEIGRGHAADDASVLAPKGKLRVGVILSSSGLINRDPSGNFSGIIADVVNGLADHLGAVSELIPYDNPTRFNLSLGKDEWDVAFMPRDLSRTGQLAFTAPFMEVDIGYLARTGASLTAVQDVDRRGIKVAVVQGSPTAGFLARNLKNAELVRLPAGLSEAAQALSFGRADVYADNVSQLYRIAAEVPGAMVLVGRFNTVQMTIAIPKDRISVLPMLNDFVAGLKRDGTIADAIKRAGLSGARPAH